MNSCPHAKNIIAYRLDLLNKGERQQFEAHLKQCSACQQEIKLESIIEQELATVSDPGQIEQCHDHLCSGLHPLAP
jgi:anti-sigma factor RsiW